jgi:HEAT repeat.
LLVAELKAREPEIRAAAADALAMVGPIADETPALLAVLNDPVPAVREAAATALAMSKDPAAALVMERYVRRSNPASLRPQKAPDATWLRAKTYPGSVYSFASSSANDFRWEFFTTEPPAKVVAFYKASAKKGPLTAAELRDAYGGKSAMEQVAADVEASGLGSGGNDDSGMPSADDLAKAMAIAQKLSEQMQEDLAGKSPEEMTKALTQGAAAQATPLPIEKYESAEAFGSPRFLVLEEATYLGSVRPLTYVVVYEDKAFRKTGFAILKAPE